MYHSCKELFRNNGDTATWALVPYIKKTANSKSKMFTVHVMSKIYGFGRRTMALELKLSDKSI
jgi:hypothetical protein